MGGTALMFRRTMSLWGLEATADIGQTKDKLVTEKATEKAAAQVEQS
jgi:hypothetical protein